MVTVQMPARGHRARCRPKAKDNRAWHCLAVGKTSFLPQQGFMEIEIGQQRIGSTTPVPSDATAYGIARHRKRNIARANHAFGTCIVAPQCDGCLLLRWPTACKATPIFCNDASRQECSGEDSSRAVQQPAAVIIRFHLSSTPAYHAQFLDLP